MFLLSSCDFCFKIDFFKKKIFQEHYQSVKSLDPGQDRRAVGPYLDPKLFAKVISLTIWNCTVLKPLKHDFN